MSQMNSKKKILLLRMPSPILRKVNHPVHYYPPLTLKYIQSILKKEAQLEVRLIDGWVDPLALEESLLLNSVCSYQPDVMVVFSNFVNPNSVLAFLNKIKRPRTYTKTLESHILRSKEVVPLFASHLKDLFIIAIGPNVTWEREKFLFSGSPIDIIIPGDAEKEVADLIIKLYSKEANKVQTRNVYRKRFVEKDSLVILERPDSLPFPEFSKDEMLKYFFAYPVRFRKKIYCGYIKTSWGCPHRCTFCSQAIRKSYGGKVRMRSAPKIVDEMHHLVEKGANFISFEDDNFTSSKAHILSLCREIKRRNLRVKWAAQGRTDEVGGYLLEKMADAGCSLLQFGVESGSERIIHLLKKTESPKLWVSKAKETFREAKKVGISTCALFIIGSPTETVQDVEKSIEAARSLDPDLLKIHFFYPYPGSSVSRTFSKELSAMKLQDAYHHEIPWVRFSKMNLNDIIRLRKKFYREVYLRPNFIIKHFLKYFFYYLHNVRNLRFLARKTVRLFFR